MAEILHNLKGGNVRSNVVVQPASVVLNSSETLDAGTYSGRILVVNDTAGSDRTFTLDDPEKPGIRYNFVYGGDAASGHDIVIAAESEECYSQLYPGAEALSETVQHIVDIIEDSK